jgi:hypothetical protein
MKVKNHEHGAEQTPALTSSRMGNITELTANHVFAIATGICSFLLILPTAAQAYHHFRGNRRDGLRCCQLLRLMLNRCSRSVSTFADVLR